MPSSRTPPTRHGKKLALAPGRHRLAPAPAPPPRPTPPPTRARRRRYAPRRRRPPIVPSPYPYCCPPSVPWRSSHCRRTRRAVAVRPPSPACHGAGQLLPPPTYAPRRAVAALPRLAAELGNCSHRRRTHRVVTALPACRGAGQLQRRRARATATHTHERARSHVVGNCLDYGMETATHDPRLSAPSYTFSSLQKSQSSTQFFLCSSLAHTRMVQFPLDFPLASALDCSRIPSHGY
ncbi:hypothetical protein BS78_K004200 [Paspalum vaginatum]|uniref:Uncharacterized protein n=1 Tax=Paspalum vaginatum TaxID=158149 RepID=A0A9W7XDC1_9POAL|nr:hypothetical protein BS78_K004200 [Paspalum vaginatum]